MSNQTKMSETTALGVEMMNGFVSNASHMHNADDEELQLHQRILQSKALDDRRARQKAEEDLKFCRHKLADRDKKLEEARTQLAAQSRQITTLQKHLDAKDSSIASIRAHAHDLATQLERFKANAAQEIDQLRDSLQLATSNGGRSGSRRMSSDNMFSPTGSMTPVVSGTDFAAGDGKLRRTNSTLSNYIAEKAKNLGMKRKFKNCRQYHELASQAMECALMEEADVHSMVTERCFARGVTPINDLLKAEAGIDVPETADSLNGSTKRVSNLVSYDGIKRYGRGTIGGHILSFNEPLETKMPEDVYIDAKVQASGFNAEYKEFKQGIHSFAKQFKKESDTALNALWFIFTEKDKGARGGCVLANPKEDFQKELRTALTKTRTRLTDLVRTFNTHLKTILGNERKVKQQWLKEQRPSKEFECQVDIPPPEDPRIALLQEEVAFLQSRQAQIHAEHTSKSSDLEMQREKAEVNMQFLQQKVHALHGAVHIALHSVYKHRFHWGPRCPNHFTPLEKEASKKRQLEVGYNVLLGEAIDMEIKSLGQFADYFVSDQLFGVDLAAAFNPVNTKEHDTHKENEVPLVMRRKEAVPMKRAKVDQARKLSTQLDTMLKGEQKQQAAASIKEESSLAAPVSGGIISARALEEAAVELKATTPPPNHVKRTQSVPFASVSTQQQVVTTSARRCSNIPRVATIHTTSRKPPMTVSPPNNTHVDAHTYSHNTNKPPTIVTVTNTRHHTPTSPSPSQAALLPTSTFNMELGFDAAPKAPVQPRFQGNRRTSSLSGFVAFAQ